MVFLPPHRKITGQYINHATTASVLSCPVYYYVILIWNITVGVSDHNVCLFSYQSHTQATCKRIWANRFGRKIEPSSVRYKRTEEIGTSNDIQTFCLLGAFAKLRKSTITFVMSVRLFVRMEQLGSYWADFH